MYCIQAGCLEHSVTRTTTFNFELITAEVDNVRKLAGVENAE